LERETQTDTSYDAAELPLRSQSETATYNDEVEYIDGETPGKKTTLCSA